MLPFRIAPVVALPLLAFVGGCFSSDNTITGKVTLDGKPLADAVVSFVPESGDQNALGRTDQQGNYQLFRRDEPGAPVGKYTVRITSTPVVTASADAEVTGDAYLAQVSGTASRSASTTASKDPIPTKYNSQSELTATVEKGANTFDFDLHSH